MAVLFLPSYRRWQPQTPTDVNWANPLTRGLSFLVSNRTLVQRPGSAPLIGSGLFYSANLSSGGPGKGLSPSYNGTTTAAYMELGALPAVPVGATLFALCQSTIVNGGVPISLGNNPDNNLLFRLVQNAGNWTFQARSTASQDVSINDTVTPVAGQWYSVCGIYRQGTGAKELYVDGRLGATSSTNTAGSYTNNIVSIGAMRRGTTNATYLGGLITIAAVFQRALAVEEVKALVDNPWQLLRMTRRRIWVLPPAPTAALSVTLTGVSAAAAVDSLTGAITETETLTGVSAAGSVDSITAELTESETLTGLTAVGNVGNLTADVSFDASVTLTEVSAAGAVNDLTVEIVGDALSETLTGVTAAAAVGTLSVVSDTADSVSLAGVSGAAAVGDLDAVSSDILDETLTGVSAQADVFDLTATISDADSLTGVSALAQVGTLTVDVTEETDVTLTGVSAAAAVSDLTIDLSLQFEVELTGVSAVGRVRDLIIPDEGLLLDEEIRAALAPLVKGNVHPLRRPQYKGQAEADAHLPEIVWTIVSDDWEQAHTLCGPGLHATRVQIDVYAKHYREARAFAYAVAAEMDELGWRINMQPFPDDAEGIYRWQLEYSCWRNEAPPSLPLSMTHRG